MCAHGRHVSCRIGESVSDDALFTCTWGSPTLRGVDGERNPSLARAAFLTHSNYLRAFYTIMEAEYVEGWMPLAGESEILAGLASRIRSSGLLSRLRPPAAPIDSNLLRRTLRNAWGTEILLATRVDDELLGIANNWNVVQAYYACYQAVQALTAARGQSALTSHEKLQNAFSATWIVRSVQLAPWSFGYRLGHVENPPHHANFRMLRSTWEACDHESCWSIARTALKTTREDSLAREFHKARAAKKDVRRRVWRDERDAKAALGKSLKRKEPTATPNLSAAEKGQIDKRLRVTSLIDYLYRLRMRSNYEDPTMFTDGPDDSLESYTTHRHLSTITAATLMLHELQIKELIGEGPFEGLAADWLRDAGSAQTGSLGLQSRYALLFPN